MPRLIKPLIALCLGASSGLALAHVDHAHGHNSLQLLLHPLTGPEHLTGLLLAGWLLYLARRLAEYRHAVMAAAVLMIPLLCSYTLTTTAVVSLNFLALGLLLMLRFSLPDTQITPDLRYTV